MRIRREKRRSNAFFLMAAAFILAIPLFHGPTAFPMITEEPGGESGRFEYVPGEVLVKFKKEVTAEEKRRFHQEADTEVISEIPEIGVQKVRSRRGESTEELIERYKQNPQVEYAEPNGIFKIQLTPDDPRFSDLWGLHNIGQTITRPDGTSFTGTLDADIDAPEAWDLQTGSLDVIVADIDTGVDYRHPDLAENIWTNPGEIPGNGVDDDANGFVDDYYGWDFGNNDNDPMDDMGHGTHTSGTVAAVGNNGVGVVGVAWTARIMAVKFMDASGNGTFEAAANAILYASRMGARVSNNSWGCQGTKTACFSGTVEDALGVAYQRGMLFVVAAGNSSMDNDSVQTHYPCASTVGNVLCVAATDYNDQLASFSNYGATSVDVGAPGVNVLSTVPTVGAPCCSDPSGYKFLNGTSMATPHVAGAAALTLAQFPTLTTDVLKSVITGSVDPLAGLAGITLTGGRLNANNALATLFSITGTPAVQQIRIGQSASFTITVHSVNSFSAPVTLNLISPEPTITGSFSNNRLTPPSNGSVSASLTITTTATTPRGAYVLRIQGTDDTGKSYQGWVALQVSGQDFSFSATPLSRTIVRGSTAPLTYIVTVTSFERYSRSVTLSMTASDPNLSGSFSPNPVTPPRDGSVNSTLTVPPTAALPTGTHTLTIQGYDGIRTRTAKVDVVVTDVDLLITALSGPRNGVTGESITISFTVKNQGTTGTGGFGMGLYLSTDVTIETTDIFLGAGMVEGLAAGASHSSTYSRMIPHVSDGTYYLGVIADYGNWISETNESNNSLTGDTISISIGPDLVMTAVSGPTSAVTGTRITITDTVKNRGTGASGYLSFFVQFCLVADPTVRTCARNYESRLVNGLEAGASSTGSTSFDIRTSLSPGTYYLLANADFDDIILESDESNNSLVGDAISITIGPDLVMTAVSGPTSAQIGSSITLLGTAKNQGIGFSEYFSVGLYLSTDATITAADTFLRWYGPFSLAPGASTSFSTTATIPSTLAAGTYYLGAIVDDMHYVVETSEENNALTGNTITITVPAKKK